MGWRWGTCGAVQQRSSEDRCVLMVYPDTGHRYAGVVRSVFEHVRPVTDYTPHRLVSRGQAQRLPWYCVHWGGSVPGQGLR